MRILLAHGDRDFLHSYGELLALDGYEAAPAFDGAQAARLLADGPWDAAVLGEDLPRVTPERLLPLMRREGVPVILLVTRKVTARRLLEPELPAAFLPCPFRPEEMRSLLKRLLERRDYRCAISFGGVRIDPREFRFAGTDVRLTLAEIELAEALAQGKSVVGRRVRPIVSALNEKLARQGTLARITYEQGKGYQLVTKYE